MRNGPFRAWMQFCERGLQETDDHDARSGFLWTLGQVARRAGEFERTLDAARRKTEVDRERGDDRGIALAQGLVADVLAARGQLDEALRIRQEEELPVYERLGARREILVARANIALTLIDRNAPGDRDEAIRLLYLALEDARDMRLPEAGQIEGILEQLH